MVAFLNSIITQRQIVWTLAKSDFKSRYLGSALGALWAFVLPLVNLGVIWFAFQQGVKSATSSSAPFILWLITGLFPWTFFSDGISAASNSLVEKAFLVKKVVFQVELIPLIKVLAAMLPFLFLSLVTLILFCLYGYAPDIYWIQLLYYAFCLCILVLSLSWLTSSVVVFYRDLSQVINMCLQLGFWATPVFWNPDNLSGSFKYILFLNPMAYIVNGYRESLISKVWFWEKPLYTVYFWILVSIFSFLGLFLFKKLRPHFADVL